MNPRRVEGANVALSTSGTRRATAVSDAGDVVAGCEFVDDRIRCDADDVTVDERVEIGLSELPSADR